MATHEYEVLPRKDDIFPVSSETFTGLRKVLAGIVSINPVPAEISYNGLNYDIDFPVRAGAHPDLLADYAKNPISPNSIHSGQVWVGDDFPDLVVNMRGEATLPGTPVQLNELGTVDPIAETHELRGKDYPYAVCSTVLDSSGRVFEKIWSDDSNNAGVTIREIGELDAQDLLAVYQSMEVLHRERGPKA